MLDQAILRDQFEELLAGEKRAAEVYEQLLARADDPDLREQLGQLHREKLRHVQLTERLLEIVD
jgi:rubrerythrin